MPKSEEKCFVHQTALNQFWGGGHRGRPRTTVFKRLRCLMFGSSHIRSVLIGVEYRNCGQTLDVFLLFATLLGQIKSTLNYRLVNYKLASP